jgi:hypothetical protein
MIDNLLWDFSNIRKTTTKRSQSCTLKYECFHYEPVWLCGSVHVSCGSIVSTVWLTVTHVFKLHGAHTNCVPNAG